MVSAEMAVALPVLVLALAIAVWAVALAGAQLRCVEAARAGARAAALGESPAVIRDRAALMAGGAEIEVTTEGDLVVVRVQRRLAPPWPVLRGLGAVTVAAEARAAAEPESAP